MKTFTNSRYIGSLKPVGIAGIISLVAMVLMICPKPVFAQAEVEGWGNMNGIRVDGQLLSFETSVRVVNSDWSAMRKTAKERQRRPIYSREGSKQSVSTNIDSIYLKITVEDTGRGTANIQVDLDAHADTTLSGVFFGVQLPSSFYDEGSLSIGDQNLSLRDIGFTHQTFTSSNVEIKSARGQLILSVKEPQEIIAFKDSADIIDDVVIYFPIVTGAVKAGQKVSKNYSVLAGVVVDDSPATLTLDTSNPGRVFHGLGGNFRLQNPETDPPVIDYCLKNLRVAWARVEMPWFFWHPEQDKDPLTAARAGDIHPRVVAAMEMAQRLHGLGIPVMIADWSAPAWAIIGEHSRGPQPGGLRGNALNQEKAEKIYRSIGDYVQYMKEEYGVEARMFSFNESDLGIDVRQTDAEHTKLIKELGAHFKSRGLNTKLLLGDTADANGWPFINHAMDDAETHPYLGAVSFHSWRGWTPETLGRWAAAAERLNLPLIVGEGSIDAAAWRFPRIFEEPTYARAEINLYTRILAICQPLSILQWQLTADYSVMSGGGVFGNYDEPLHPTQRFWNLKQLGSTPPGLRALSVTCDNEELTAAALGDNSKGIYVVHLVNNGAKRPTTLTGVPKGIKRFWVYTTDHHRGMAKSGKVKVRKNQANFTTDAVSYTTLTTVKFE